MIPSTVQQYETGCNCAQTDRQTALLVFKTCILRILQRMASKKVKSFGCYLTENLPSCHYKGQLSEIQ